jgi:hypothetical protein
MLEKIINITPGSEFKNSSKSPELLRYAHASKSPYFSINDSVNFSPAIQYLKTIEWQLKELSKTANEKLLITFCISELEFRVVVDLSALSKLSFITYEIKRKRSASVAGQTLIVLTSIISEVLYDENNVSLHLNALNKLLDRFEKLNITDELNGIDIETLSYLAEDISVHLQTEFEYINKFLLVFIEKLTGKKINTGTKSFHKNEQSIIIEKMKLINA